MKPRILNTYPVHELIEKRWSGRAFSSKPVEEDKIKSLFEAARWAPSSFNEQPWRYIITRNGTQVFSSLYNLLMEGNKNWTLNAPLLVLTIAKTFFDHNGKSNRHALHDLGLSIANLVFQATAFDLNVHQLGGFNKDQAEKEFQIPEGYEAVSVLAIGYRGEANQLDEAFRKLEFKQQQRSDQKKFVFTDRWQNTQD